MENCMFTELTNDEMYDIDGGMPFILGVLAAGAIVVGVAVVVAVTVVVVGKAAQAVSDWIG